MATNLPSDASSLLVPVHLDAWVVDSQNQQVTSWYLADYSKLASFRSPLPDPFNLTSVAKAEVGIHLHWALPDALTHGKKLQATAPVEFPLVPNRWLIARFNTPAGGSWQGKFWVVQSDYLNATDGTSAFLDPFTPTTMVTTPGQSTQFNIQDIKLGKNYTLDAWEARTAADGQLFLQAVGPGNISFAAYAPFVNDVFSFTDTELPPEGTGIYSFTYMVVGWYSDPATADPLRGVASFIPGVWKDQTKWQKQTPAERFATLLADLKWSVAGDPGANPPLTSLYHGLVVDVQWPFMTLNNAGIDLQDVRVAVGNTATDALAALIQAEAQRQANTEPGPTKKNAWLTAGDTLAALCEAALYDLLDDYGKPGGAALVQQQIHQAWFGSQPGGTLWEAVSDIPQSAGQDAVTAQLTPAQITQLNQVLAALNQSQRTCDQAQRKLESGQANLYAMWWKVAYGRQQFGFGEGPTTEPAWSVLQPFMEQTIYPNLFSQVWQQYCDVQQQQEQLAKLTADVTATLAQLGLKLKASAQPRFWHPNDPVLLLTGLQRAQKHGEDGRYSSDGTMLCRLPGQTITGLNISGQPLINEQTVTGVNFNPTASYKTIPALTNLFPEAFFADPANAPLIAQAVNGDSQTIQQAITALLNQTPGSGTWDGAAPVPFALRLWEQAWAPLFLEWDVNYYPTGLGSGPTRQFSLADWRFDGSDYTWQGTGFDQDYFAGYKGRTLLTPQAALLFQSKLSDFLKDHQSLNSTQLEALLTTVGNWDLLSQSLSGLTDQMITLLSQETFPPTPDDKPTVPCPPGATPPSATALIGEQYRAVPKLEAARSDVNNFYPVRGGLLQFQQLQIVDCFGQTYGGLIAPRPPIQPMWPQPFYLGQGLTPTNPPSNAPAGALQLPPRVAQSTRLDFRFLANKGSAQDIQVADNPNAVCGWLLPNHLDNAIAVYDANGIMLGELLPLPAPDNWRPRPGAPGANPPPATPNDIENVTLRAVINSLASRSAAVFQDVLRVIDETLWMVDPLGGRQDQFLSVLLGRPLAVVQAQLQLSLYGDPVFNQMWNNMLAPDAPPNPPYNQWLNDTGHVEDTAFPVRLGSLELRNDGLIGYYFATGTNAYQKFYTVHYPDQLSAGDQYLQQILQPATASTSATYQGDLTLRCQGEAVTLALLLDPRGSVHAYTGVLPVTTAALPAHLVEAFMRQLKVSFRTGPIMTAPDTLRLPLPAEQHGVWQWLQAVAAPVNWQTITPVDADDQARLPDAQLQLREGWLQLSDLTDTGAR